MSVVPKLARRSLRARIGRSIAIGLAILALTFSVVSNLVVTIGTICAERLTYLPSAGALIAVGVAVERLAGKSPGRRGLALAVVVVLVVVHENAVDRPEYPQVKLGLDDKLVERFVAGGERLAHRLLTLLQTRRALFVRSIERNAAIFHGNVP